MIGIHTTTNGKAMLVAEMSNDHLFNLIRLRLKTIAELNHYLENGNSKSMVSSLNAVDTPSPEQLKDKMIEVTTATYRYVYMLVLRGYQLEKVTQMMQGVYGDYRPAKLELPEFFQYQSKTPSVKKNENALDKTYYEAEMSPSYSLDYDPDSRPDWNS